MANHQTHLHHALHSQLAHARLVALPQHSNEGPQRVLLVGEVFQLSAHQQLRHKLPQRVDGIQRHAPARRQKQQPSTDHTG